MALVTFVHVISEVFRHRQIPVCQCVEIYEMQHISKPVTESQSDVFATHSQTQTS